MFHKKLNELPKEMSSFIHMAGALADEKGINAYVVGGFVRDIFLGVKNFDVDLVVEGDGIAFASECARNQSLKLVTHKRFGTATIHGLHGFKVDIASARREIYEEPAALPVVFKGHIRDDLFRRDFTVNAMAISINKHCFGQIIDHYDGHSDLKTGVIRALHVNSFIDDPTRIMRAVRFEQRFDFKIDKETLSWIKSSLRRKMLHQVQKHRLRDELILIFKERSPVRSLRRLWGLAGFSYIALGLRFHKGWHKSFEDVAKKARWFDEHFSHKRHLEPYVMYMSLFFSTLTHKELCQVMRDFAFHKGESSRIISFRENFARVEKELSKKSVRASTVYRILEPLSYEVVLLSAALSSCELVVKRVQDFLFVYNGQRIHVKGDDLKGLGVKPGPHFKKILDELLYAKIDAEVSNKEEELVLAQRKIKEHMK